MLCVALGLGAFVPLFSAPAAIADLEFCPPGKGAGQCAAPLPEDFSSLRGLALDFETSRLYVADRVNNRVDVFAENGSFLFAFGWGVDTGAAALQTCTAASTCQAGLAGSGAGQLDKPTKVAVDNDPASPNHHLVYLVDGSRVQLFDPSGSPDSPVTFVREIGGFSGTISIGVGPGGVLYVLDNVAGNQRLQRFGPSGAPITPPPPPAECTLLAGMGTAISLAVDGAGNFWVATEGTGEGIRKYAPDCTLLFLAQESSGIETNQVALDEAGNPFATQSEVRDAAVGSFRVITTYDPATGNLTRRFVYGRIPDVFRPEGLAVRSNGGVGGIFVSVRQPGFFIKRLDFPPPPPTLPSPGPLPAPPSMEVKEIGSTKAKLIAEVNPEGKATTVHFEYLTQAEYEAQGNSFSGPATKNTTPKSLGATGFNLKTVEDLAGCPNPASEAGESGSKCLLPETLYRWRVVATNADNPTGSGESTVEGTPFKTSKSLEIVAIWASGVGTDTARLNGEVDPNGVPATGFFEYADDAAYRKDIDEGGDGFVAATKAPSGAPLDFGSGDEPTTRQVTISPLSPGTVYHFRLLAQNPLIEPLASDSEELRTFAAPESEPNCPNDASRIGLGAFLPDCRAYEMVSPIEKEGGDIRVLNTSLVEPAVLEQSSLSGERLAYGSVRSFGGAASGPLTSQYIAGRIAGKEWATHPINPPRERPILPAIFQIDTEFKVFSADLCDAWLETFAEPPLAAGALAGYSNLYRRTDELCSADGRGQFEALAPIAQPETIPPGPNIAPVPNFLMELLDVSADGEHAIFWANDKLVAEGTTGSRQLYESVRGAAPRLVCILPGGAAVSGSCAAAGDPGAQTGTISEDGERIFWSAPGTGEGKIYVRIGGTQTIPVSAGGEALSGTGTSWFWGAAADGSVAIFSTRVGPGASDLYQFDVDAEATALIAEGVVGVMGISEDASRVYFASSEVLSGEEENGNGDKAVAGEVNLYLHEAGQAPGSARFIATLDGADLVQAVLNEPSRKHTARVSPDGAHAAFTSVAPLTGYDNTGAASGDPTEEVYRYDANAGELTCVSCNPAGARPAGTSSIPFWQTGAYAARVLSDDGARLYFESADALAARDANGRVDVYQWEEEGAGGCDEGDGAFSPNAGGCVDLISSGESPLGSRFVEADPTGKNVFLATGSSLLPQDPDVTDIYDARVEGGLPIPIPPPSECEGDSCAAQIPAPEAPAAASSDYVAPPAARKHTRRCAKGKRRVSRKGKSRCVAKHKRRRPAR